MRKPDQEYWKSLLMKLQYFEEEIKVEDKALSESSGVDILREIIREQMKDEDTLSSTRTAG
jgi:hypothetical protein